MLQRRVGDALNVLPELHVVAAQEETRQLGQVLDAVAQRRHPQRDDVQAVVEVLAERSLLDRLLQVDVGGRNQPEVGLDRVRPADALDLALLDGAQQLGLQLVAQVADLVQEQRAAGCASSNLPSCWRMAPVNAPFFVAEQRAFDQLPRESPRG